MYITSSINVSTEKFLESNRQEWDCLLNQREDYYYKYSRSEHLLDLYGQCLQEEPPYIPRKFRNDTYHTMSQQEKNVIAKSNLQRFQTECEILKLRRDHFTQKIIEKDNQLESYINPLTA